MGFIVVILIMLLVGYMMVKVYNRDHNNKVIKDFNEEHKEDRLNCKRAEFYRSGRSRLRY